MWNQPSWWSDDVDWHAYGEDIDWSKNFNEQCRDFMRKVPQTCLDNAYKLLENSEYVNGNGKSRDCYLVSCGSGNEKCLYGYFAFENSSLLNCNYARFSENSSYSTHIWKSYDVHFSFNISECRNTWYSLSCEGSQYLLGCVGIKNGKYQILNVPCTEDEFITTLAKLRNNKEFKKIFENNVLELIAQVGIEKNILT